MIAHGPDDVKEIDSRSFQQIKIFRDNKSLNQLGPF